MKYTRRINLNRILKITLVIILYSASNLAKAAPPIGIGVTTGLAELEAFQSQMVSTGQALQILPDHTGKFDNDNSFVQLYHPKFNSENLKIVNRDVYVVLPSHFNADSLMETLIKIRAAKTFGATQVTVVSHRKLSDLISSELGFRDLGFESLIAFAGAEFIREEGIVRELNEIKPRKNRVSNPDYWIGGSNDPILLSEIASLIGKSPKTFEELQSSAGDLNGRKIYWLSASTRPINENFFMTLSQIQWLERQGASVHLISPYLPYARSDKPEFDVGVTTQGRLVADLIESVGTEAITVVRAHAPQSLGFFKIPAFEISGRRTIVDYLKSKEVECVISPDAGFQKDATKYQQELNHLYDGKKRVSLVVMNKQRDSSGKEIILGGTGLENVTGKKVVILDDETASGSTLNDVAAAIQTYGPVKTFAVVTHLAGTGKRAFESEFIQKLVSTNTVPITTSHSKLKVLSIASEISESILAAEGNR